MIQIIPAIDIIGGKCVRLSKGDFTQMKVYNEHPLEVALQFQDAGISRLHLVDLDGAKTGKVKNWKVLETIAGKTNLEIDFGGGIKTKKDVDIVFDSGGAMVTVGSIAVKDEKLLSEWLQHYGQDKFLIGADVKDERIAIAGWLETVDIRIDDFLQQYIEKGVHQFFCTDVSRDGQLQGPSIALYRNLLQKFPAIKLIASGGVSNLADLDALQAAGCAGVIIGKAIYEGRITLKQLASYMKSVTG
jgi:phosphoribosylformimino-5-aminoimidazole carboxamide ribotide isomerase